jgi:chromosome partitioning protein
MGLKGSQFLSSVSDDLDESLRAQAARLLSPDKRKSDKDLRRFTIREVADLCLRTNYNSLRNYLRSVEGLPEGILETGNRRTFSLEEVHEIQEKLFAAGKLSKASYPRRMDNEKPVKISIFNLKGGVSKTTLAVNLAEGLACRGYRVLVLDVDPQASCSDMFDVQADLDQLPSLYEVLRYQDVSSGEGPIPIVDAIQATYFPNIDLVPGSIGLTEFEYETSLAASKGIPFYSRISDALNTIEDAYDVILFDTPPHMSFAVIAVLYASDGLLIPLSAGMLDVVSLVKFTDLASVTLDSIENVVPDKEFDFMRLVLTRYSPNDAAQLQLSSFLRATLGNRMLQTDFLSSTAIADAGNTMNPLLEVDPSSFNRKTYDRILESVQGIVHELEDEIMRARGRIPVDKGET